MAAVWKKFAVFISLPFFFIFSCGGGGGGSAGSGGGSFGGGSCSAMTTQYVNPTECWEYSTDESNAGAHCALAGGVYSASACDETLKIATCTTLFPPGSLTGSLFTVYWYIGDPLNDFNAACLSLGGTLTSP